MSSKTTKSQPKQKAKPKKAVQPPKPPSSGPSVDVAKLSTLQAELASLKRSLKTKDDVEEHGTPQTKAVIRHLLCPDELVPGKALPVLPIGDASTRFDSLQTGSSQVVIPVASGTPTAEFAVINAPGQHTVGFYVVNSVGDHVQPGEVLLVNLSPSEGCPSMCWSVSQVPSYWATASSLDYYTVPPPPANFVTGFIMSSTVAPNLPTPTVYTGQVFFPLFDTSVNTMGFGVAAVTNKPIAMLGYVTISRSNITPVTYTNTSMVFCTNYLNQAGSVLTVTPVVPDTASDLRRLTDRDISVASQLDASDVRAHAYPRVYPTANIQLLSLASTLDKQVPLQALSIGPNIIGAIGGGSVPLNTSIIGSVSGLPAPDSFWRVDLLRPHALQWQMGELNVNDENTAGCNIRCALFNSPSDLNMEVVDLAFFGRDMMDASFTVQAAGGASNVPIPNFEPGSGWGHCCTWTVVTGQISTALPLLVKNTVWAEYAVTPVSGLPVRRGDYDPAFQRSLQQIVDYPVLATYHSFKDFLNSGLKKVASAGRRVASAAWKAGREVAVSSLATALLA